MAKLRPSTLHENMLHVNLETCRDVVHVDLFNQRRDSTSRDRGYGALTESWRSGARINERINVADPARATEGKEIIL
jgi:hypothetical protein